jgi:hypothetical protein
MKNIISIDAIKKFGFEFLSIFIGVFAAFALDSWNETRKDKYVEVKILSEINNGLKQDIQDIELNVLGHKQGIEATTFFQKLYYPYLSIMIRPMFTTLDCFVILFQPKTLLVIKLLSRKD